ncbi:hypothetical protein CHUAL_004857 [Chamberlinius hualienensis]
MKCFMPLIACIGLLIALLTTNVETGIVKRHIFGGNRGPVYPYGYPNNIPSGGDLISNGGYYPGYGYNDDPCRNLAASMYDVYSPGYSNLYYGCKGLVATLYECPPGTQFYRSYSGCR